MKIANTLKPEDAKRMLALLANPREGTSADSCIAVEDLNGQPVTKKLAHICFEKLAAMPSGLRRKLLASGHVYVQLGNVRYGSVHTGATVVGGAFTFDSPIFGEAVGIGHYTKPGPGIQALPYSDMNERFSFHRVMPEMYSDTNGNFELIALDSDLRLYMDVGMIEANALKQATHKPAAR